MLKRILKGILTYLVNVVGMFCLLGGAAFFFGTLVGVMIWGIEWIILGLVLFLIGWKLIGIQF